MVRYGIESAVVGACTRLENFRALVTAALGAGGRAGQGRCHLCLHIEYQVGVRRGRRESSQAAGRDADKRSLACPLLEHALSAGERHYAWS